MKNKICLFICSVWLAVFGVTSIFLGEIISYRFFILSFFYYACMALLYTFMLRSKKLAESAVKWVISLPISYLIFQYFWKTNYAIRALNWVFEGYGRQNAGGNFAGMFQLATFGFFSIVAILIIYRIKIENHDIYQKAQIYIGSVLGIIIVAITLALESMFPEYSHIFGG